MLPDSVAKWLAPNLGIKRWLAVALIGIVLIGFGVAISVIIAVESSALLTRFPVLTNGWTSFVSIVGGITLTTFAIRRMIRNILAPYRRQQRGDVVDVVMDHNRRSKGVKFVAIGGGTGLPASLIGMKQHTSNITAVVTVADDGGSSGRLRRDMGVLPPGDIRNNIAALADDDSVLTHLFQYRFTGGDLDGHSFGNLFIAALASIAEERGNKHNSLAEALVEVERVLNIKGRVIPSTLDDVTLTASVKLHGSSRSIKVRGESNIGDVDGVIDTLELHPADAQAHPPSVQAILNADIIVIGPGSLYTSILPNLMVNDIADALRATDAYIIYVCNVATQPVETEGYTVAEHIMALERHIGRGVFQAVLANNHFPQENAGANTKYVPAAPDNHEIHQRYEIHMTDLTDSERPWRHDPYKLAAAILRVCNRESRIPALKNAV